MLASDVAVLRKRLRVTADYYHRLSTDLLSPEPTILPWVLGFLSNLQRNIGHLKNNGVELQVDAEVLRTSKFSWNVFAPGAITIQDR